MTAREICSTISILEHYNGVRQMIYPMMLLILLNNTQPIPVYTIHDVIEPFNCKNDMKLCDEFYVDETLLDNYGIPLKIEAGFYSSNLISYLVDSLHIITD